MINNLYLKARQLKLFLSLIGTYEHTYETLWEDAHKVAKRKRSWQTEKFARGLFLAWVWNSDWPNDQDSGHLIMPSTHD